MSAGNQINTSVSSSNSFDLEKNKNRVGPNKPFTFKDLVEWIKMQGFDEYTESGLIEEASKYPSSALKSFKKNMHLMIMRVRERRKKEEE